MENWFDQQFLGTIAPVDTFGGLGRFLASDWILVSFSLLDCWVFLVGRLLLF